jgi:hypothetical protein
MKNEEKDLILHWFEHIAQLATDKKTLNGVVMSDEDAFAEIASLAKNACYYIQTNISYVE